MNKDNIVLHIVFKELPPTANHIYIRGTILTSQARAFSERFSKYVAQNHLHELNKIDVEGIYAVHLRFYFETLTNATWNDLAFPPSKRAKTRYKRIDLDNRIKLLTDCLRDAIGVDDCQFFAGTQEKHQDLFNPRLEIFLERLKPETYGVGVPVRYGKPPEPPEERDGRREESS